MHEDFPNQDEEYSREKLIARLRQASNLAHSISQPLTSALLTSQFVREAVEQLAATNSVTSLETLRADANTIEQNMIQLKNLLDDLRTIVRLPSDLN